MATAYLNIGSNIGDRAAHLERAVAAVQRLFGEPCRCSAIVESEPWGFDSENKFLNVGVALSTNLGAEEILRILQQAETACGATEHRDERGGYIDRNVDIDFIALDGVVWNSDRLTLPHPRMHERRFVLEPMAELCADWTHPLLGLTVRQMLDNCQ